jgi:chemotaxis protein CheD
MRQIVMVSDLKLGQNGDELVTHALGSCLGLTVYDPQARVGGLLHAMLPLSQINPEKAQDNPYMFVDTGVPAMFRLLYEMGAVKSRLIVKAVGCGAPLGDNQLFKIGERNFTILKKLLWKNNVLLKSHDVGGTKSRTVHFDLTGGQVRLSSKGEVWEL